MANKDLTHDMIADRFLLDLKNELTFSQNVFKGYKDEFHAVGGFKKGNSVRVKLPNKYRAKSGSAIDTVDTFERETQVTVDKQEHVALKFGMADWTLDIEGFSKKHLVPAAIALANKVDRDGLALYQDVYNLVGTPGTTPATFAALTAAAERLDNEAIMREGRTGILSPKAAWALAGGDLKSVFVQDDVRRLTKKGFVGSHYAMADFFADQNVQAHTNGTWTAGAVTVKAAPAEGATTISLQGLTATTGTINKGDVFTIATVAGVNPVSGITWENGQLRQFVATATATADGAGDAVVSVSPPIYSSAAPETTLPYQTVNDLPAINDAVTLVSGVKSTTYSQNMIYRPEAFALTMVPFEKPRAAGAAVKWAQATDEDLGLSITVADGFDISSYESITRVDILYGWDTIQPEYAVRMTG